MRIDFAKASEFLRQFDFRSLFREQLGWDNSTAEFPIDIDGQVYSLSGVAEKRGFAAWFCPLVPDYETRKKIYTRAAKFSHEQLVIYADKGNGHQIWQWMRRERDKPIANREEFYDSSRSGDALIQKLEGLAISIDEEERISLLDVKDRARQAFDKDKVTKRFYDTFKSQHAAFQDFIRGIKAIGDLDWYTSLMMNRMMFIYFIQKKGFLDGDVEYLRTRLGLVRERRGSDKFQTFYRYFLLRLFHEGLGGSERNTELEKLLGKVPYLNGGFFEVHELERKYPEIEIPDKAFEKLFDFFDQWEWTLDDRPLRKGNEINPDVVGYIFEKYINQKQMGAYYTKEDVTEYISKNTVLPHLFDAAKKECAVAFRSDGLLWRLLQADPDRYIYEPVRRGVIDEKGQLKSLPPEIEAGTSNFSKRGGWNRPAAAGFALPTETWREHADRRKRCLEIRSKLGAGEVCKISDLVTLNLDIWQFARDAIASAEGPELLRAFWHSLQKLTVLDPACGSGAFLFAALRILESLYGACIQRMRQFVDDLERSGERHRPEKFKDFRQVLAEIERHPNESYYILKSIIIGNLFGVDIMEEAVEICKLRLFLKLAAQLHSPSEIEPLPDIDFNIRAGNSLVGFTSLDGLREAMTRQPDGQTRMLYARERERLSEIEERAEIADRQFSLFRQMQTDRAMSPAQFASAKLELRKRLDVLRLWLDRYLASEYRIDPDKQTLFEKWRASHQPFHWFVEFYGIVHAGGFGAIVGNPPWREYSAVKSDYTVTGYSTLPCGNLHNLFTERSLKLRAPEGRLSMIVQLPLVSSSRMSPARRVLVESSETLHVLPFDDRPGRLFDGLEHCRSVIFVASGIGQPRARVFGTQYQRWFTEGRQFVLPLVQFTLLPDTDDSGAVFPKYASEVDTRIFRMLQNGVKATMGTIGSRARAKNFVFYQESTGYWVKATCGLPYYAKDGSVGAPPHGRYLYLATEPLAHLTAAILNSSLFYRYFIAYGDCFHLSDQLVVDFPIPSTIPTDEELPRLGRELMKDLRAKSQKKTIKTKDGTKIEYAEYYASGSKPTIDRIDQLLAEHYGFASEDVDFIVNYDIKFRMGQNEAEEVE